MKEQKKRNNKIIATFGEDTIKENNKDLVQLWDIIKLVVVNLQLTQNTPGYIPQKKLTTMIDYVVIKQQTDLKIENVSIHR